MNQQLNETLKPTDFFDRKSIHFFNLEDKNANLQVKVMQDKKKSNWLKVEIKNCMQK